ncbi:MAG: protein kinase [Acidobacteriota bacterium]
MNLGRYEVIRELGKGAMGIVYLAKDPLIGRMVALKTIRISDSVDPEDAHEFQQRFIREAQAAGILNHPCIVTVHDIGQDPQTGLSFIAMEYAEGRNLKEVVTSGEPIDYKAIGEIVADVAEALDYAHSKGIIHRDVKPANIIVAPGVRAKITDFGIAKIASTVTNLTSTGQFLGTPNYMAPEQVKGSPVDGRSDIFSLGIVFYESLARKKPFGGDSLTTISYRIVHEPFESLRTLDERIPHGFEQIVSRCLAKDPRERYQRARDVAADIRRVLSGQPVLDVSIDGDTLLSAPKSNDATLAAPFPDAAGVPPAVEEKPGVIGTLARKVTQSQTARRRIPPLMFFGILAALVLVLAAIGFSIWQGREKIPVRDVGKEQLVARQKQLRDEGERLLRAGNTAGAYEKYSELARLAPDSPSVQERLQKLEMLRVQQMTERQRLDAAKQKLEQARQLFDQNNYQEALPLLEEALQLDPNLQEAAMYQRITTQALGAQTAQAKKQTVPGATSTTVNIAGERPRPGQTTSGSATVHVTMQSTVTDGYVLVMADDQQVVYDFLYKEGGGIFRRKSPKSIDARTEVRAGTVHFQIAVVIPSLGVNEKQSFEGTLHPGVTHQLVLHLDPATKHITHQFS